MIVFYTVMGCVLIGVLVYGLNELYNAGVTKGYTTAHTEFSSQIDDNNYHYLSEMTFGEVSSYVGKRILITIGNNLTLLFMIIGISWLVHGVGFRII